MKRILMLLAVLAAAALTVSGCAKSAPAGRPIPLTSNGAAAELTLRDSSGAPVKSLGDASKYTVIIRVDGADQTCLDNLAVYERFYDIYKNYLNILILWDNVIPKDSLGETDIPLGVNYTADADGLFAAERPSYALVDPSGGVTVLDANFSSVQKQLPAVLAGQRDGVVRAANQYILDNFCGGGQTAKPCMVSLVMEGCPDCESLDTKIAADQAITDKYDIIQVYTAQSTDQQFYDAGKVFQYAYDLQWYPSYVLLRSAADYQFIGQEPEDQVLRQMRDW